MTFILGILAAVVTTIFITSNNNFIYCADVKCFSNLLEFYAIPIDILSATFIVAGFVAVIHRSNQTHHQINLTHEQNIFSNFYEHKKQFVDMLVQFSEEHEISITGKHKLYSLLFPKNNTKELSLISKKLEGNKSALYFYIDEFNKWLGLIEKRCGESNGEIIKPNPTICNELDSFLVISKQLGVYPTDTFLCEQSYKEYFGGNDELPKDFSGYSYIVSELIMALAFFSLPKEEADNIKLVSISHYKQGINQLVESLQEDIYSEW